jgi:hypothetical protein
VGLDRDVRAKVLFFFLLTLTSTPANPLHPHPTPSVSNDNSEQSARPHFTFTISMFSQQIQSALSKSRVSAHFAHVDAFCR